MSALIQQSTEWHEMFLEFPEMENWSEEGRTNFLWQLLKTERWWCNNYKNECRSLREV